MNDLELRLKTFAAISEKLALSSTDDLEQLLQDAKRMHSGIGGNSFLASVDGTDVFIKSISLSDFEKLPQNEMSTANIFKLPLFYHYGVGSDGFGAWRELAAHRMSTEWVMTKECPNFPLLYHWRILENPLLKPPSAQSQKELDDLVHYWDDTDAVRERLTAKYSAQSFIVLFLEYVPSNLYNWLARQLKAGDDAAVQAMQFVETQLKTITDFLHTKHFVHFDSHFQNMLTDGDAIYLSDFGLVLSSEFELTHEEIEFLNMHDGYDRYLSTCFWLNCAVKILCETNEWESQLRGIVSGDHANVPESIAQTMTRYAPIALAMKEFYGNLQENSKSTEYPAARLREMMDV